jgi:hypothetical protein
MHHLLFDRRGRVGRDLPVAERRERREEVVAAGRGLRCSHPGRNRAAPDELERAHRDVPVVVTSRYGVPAAIAASRTGHHELDDALPSRGDAKGVTADAAGATDRLHLHAYTSRSPSGGVATALANRRRRSERPTTQWLIASVENLSTGSTAVYGVDEVVADREREGEHRACLDLSGITAERRNLAAQVFHTAVVDATEPCSDGLIAARPATDCQVDGQQVLGERQDAGASDFRARVASFAFDALEHLLDGAPFPCVQQRIEECGAALEVSVEAASRHAEHLGQGLDTDGLRTTRRKCAEPCLDPFTGKCARGRSHTGGACITDLDSGAGACGVREARYIRDRTYLDGGRRQRQILSGGGASLRGAVYTVPYISEMTTIRDNTRTTGTAREPLAHGVRQVPVTPSVRELSTLPRIDYADTFLVHVGPTHSHPAERWARAVLADAPLPVRSGLVLGWLSIGVTLDLARPGTLLGWRIRHRSPEFVLLGADSRLGFRAELLFKRERHALRFATLVQHESKAARLAWLAIEPVHIPVVRHLLQQASERLRPSTQRD